MEAVSKWQWRKSLAMAGEGDVVQVDQILFGTIRDHCWELGIRTGSMVECLENHDRWVLVRLGDGEEKCLTRDYAWFISVKAPPNGDGRVV